MIHDFSPSPHAPVLVIGAAGLDIIGKLRGDLHTGTSNPAHIRTSFGGVARNVAENLARLGQPVRLLTVVGRDSAGERLLQEAEMAGVDISVVRHSEEASTGTYLAVVNQAGELQTALDDMNAASLISPEYLRSNQDLFEYAAAVFVDGNLPKETLRTLFSLARKAKVPVCADPTSAALAVKLKPYLNRLAMVTPNSFEAAVLSELPVTVSRRREALMAAKKLVSAGVGIAMVALAEFGACYATSETSGHVPAIKTAIVDPTGAGDAMTATVLFALLNDISLDDAVRLGVCAASLTLRHRGAVLQDLSLEMLYDELS
ncbi:MAG: carbohydrate kinase family protein [Anaerolineales bacterium]|jgi:pseudouridine kinase|nr:carbohydrate kinase family protein [Anaerolineales bacterium]